MNDEPVGRDPQRLPAGRGRRFKRRGLDLANGERLVLGVDGTIARLDEAGSTIHSWAPNDPAWPDQAIRFGLHAQARTVTPQGRRVQAMKPPRR